MHGYDISYFYIIPMRFSTIPAIGLGVGAVAAASTGKWIYDGNPELLFQEVIGRHLHIVDPLASVHKHLDPGDFNERSGLLPPLWDEVDRLESGKFPTDQNGAYIVDVWDYLQRMSLYKYMIENFHNCEWEFLFPSQREDHRVDRIVPTTTFKELQQLIDTNTAEKLNPGSILWGLPLQHGWQFSSGRLGTKNDSTQMDPKAWWADMNYYLSVIPYFGAMDAGLAPPIVLANTHTSTESDDYYRSLFCSQPSDCPDIVSNWANFFLLVNETAAEDTCSHTTGSSSTSTSSRSSRSSRSGSNSSSGGDDDEYEAAKSKRRNAAAAADGGDNRRIVNTPIAERMDFNLSAGSEKLLASLWYAHLHSIGYALPLFEKQLTLLSEPEERFGRSWAGIVDFIAECYFKCDLLTTDVLQNLLPPRMLTDDDQVPFISDMTHLQNRAVVFVDGLYSLNTTSNGRTERMWNCSMCTEQGRAYGREMITLGLYRPIILVEDFGELVYIIKNQSMEECTACVSSDFALV